MRDDRHMPPGPASPLFFFGAMSPYSWFAAERIGRLLPDARWHGVFAGAIFKASGRVSWGLTEAREDGMADCEARAAAYGLGPISWPQPWPTNDLLIARAMTFAERRGMAPGQGAAGEDAEPGAEHAAVKALGLAAMRLAFLEGADLGEAGPVLEAGRRAGLDVEELRGALAEADIKDALRRATDDALALGIFGVPTILIGGELFWGDDRLDEAVAARSSQLAG
jgi:2-hydroxychromene-2-carboxylate isomerase